MTRKAEVCIPRNRNAICKQDLKVKRDDAKVDQLCGHPELPILQDCLPPCVHERSAADDLKSQEHRHERWNE